MLYLKTLKRCLSEPVYCPPILAMEGEKNVVNENIKNLKQRVIISVYDETNTFKETDLYKITNICNNMENKDMGGVEFLRNYDVQFEADKEDMIKKNKPNFEYCTPR